MIYNPIVSILTPTYNHEKYIAQCIDSVRNQTFTNWELIVVDDGSTDNTYRVALASAENDQRIKVFRQKNIGIFRLAETYNFALRQSRGRYIALLDGDDVWMPEKLDWQIREMELNPQIVLSWGRAYSSAYDLGFDYELHPTGHDQTAIYNNDPLGTALKQLIFGCFIPALTVVVRRDTLENAGGFVQKHNLPLVDLPTWQAFALKGKFKFIDAPLGRWRIYPFQVTKMYTANIAESFYKLALELFANQNLVLRAMGVSEHQIHNHFQKLIITGYARSGRYKLIRKDFDGAKHDFIMAISQFGFRNVLWKVRSIIGLLFWLFKIDLERFAQLIGRVSYKP